MDVNLLSAWIDAIDLNQSGPRWTATLQGKRLDVKCHRYRLRHSGGRRRGLITEFSAKARLRLLKRMATVDWPQIGNSLFITLTYPDSVIHSVPCVRNTQRYLFHRHLEKYTGKHLSAVWRVEHKKRLSGTCRGNIVPHIHLLVLSCPYIPISRMRAWWRGIIGYPDGPLSLDVQFAPRGEGASMYVAKYVGKVEPEGSLDNVPYLNRGRHYGYHRSLEIPKCESVHFPIIDPSLIAWLRAVASRKIPHYNLRFDDSFTLLGDFAKMIGDKALQNVLDDARAIG